MPLSRSIMNDFKRFYTFAPSALTFDETQVVDKVGASARLTCTATMPSALSAVVSFRWYKNGVTIDEGGECRKLPYW